MDHAPSHISGISPLCKIASVVSWVTVKSAVVDSYLETPITNGPFLVSTEALLMVLQHRQSQDPRDFLLFLLTLIEYLDFGLRYSTLTEQLRAAELTS